ncbi:hypothetical protein B5X24_HaOG207879 [Helicoverpa armigera]|uniref:FLYWCH-type domain-containing protein n=1 Tax=Helicoverpa armigera TaxID=29058 RepID=A0A2W1BH76_HELAM|nr:hypothetical protein B5X24_HaOG207879 [Helicoverpa armigera]
MVYKEYTFSYIDKTKKYLCCSRRKQGKCDAKIRLNDDGEVVLAKTDHNHPPPKYYKAPNGLYTAWN